jgi:hypothetical protein
MAYNEDHTSTERIFTTMKLTRRAQNRIRLIVATRRAEKAADLALNYDNLMDDLIQSVHANV